MHGLELGLEGPDLGLGLEGSGLSLEGLGLVNIPATLALGICWTIVSSALFALRFSRLSSVAFTRSSSNDRTPFFTAFLQAVLSSASSCQVSALIPVSFRVCFRVSL